MALAEVFNRAVVRDAALTTMPGPYTVDSSVFLNAFNPQEAGHAFSRRFLVEVQTQAVPALL